MKRTWSERDEEETNGASGEDSDDSDSQYGQLGIIESVHLQNFMCHDNLSFVFDPHVNFITGRNGSGKSAVLTAIILALGGKSGATGRYSNIKGFIKTDRSTATISVTLKNCGKDAYKPEEFGQKITVERIIKSDGTSSYKLKSQAGKIISTSKEELTNILTFMDIQIENPISVLTQEISRSFLVSKNSKADRLFQLFFKGTGLAKVQEDYSRSLQQEGEMRAELEYKKSILPEMEKDIRKLKAVLDKSSKVVELKKELAWAMVIEFERVRDEAKEAVDKVKKDYSDCTKKLKNCENDIVVIQQSVDTANVDKKESHEKMDSIQNDMKTLTQKRSVLASEIRQIQGTHSSHERQLNKLVAEIASLEALMNDIKMKNQNDFNEDKQRHETLVNTLKDQFNSKRSEIELLEQQKTSLREAAANIQKKIESCNAEVQEVNYSFNNVAKQKQQLIDGMSNRINVFGQEMANVLNEIKIAAQSRLFKVEPKGPIGLYVNVKNPEWSFAVQECLKGAFLRTFMCDNHADADYLTKILNKHYQRHRPSIITSQFLSEVHDVSPHKTVCEHPTLLDMLDVSDPVVTNCLIDQRQIENIILIADEREACNLMLYNPPQKCKFAYTPNGDQYCHSPYRNYSCRSRNQVSMLKTVNEEDIREKIKELQLLEAARSAKLTEKENLNEYLKQNEKEINKIDEEITDLKIRLKHIRVELYEAENSYEEPKNIDCLQIDMEKLQNEKKHHEEQYISSKTIMTEKTEELTSLDQNLKEYKRILQVESRSFQNSSEKVQDLESKKEKLEYTVKKVKEHLTKILPILESKEKDLSNAEATVMISTQNAVNASDRINTRRSPETIRQILIETEKFIKEQRNSDQETVLKEYEEKYQYLKKKKLELERLEKMDLRIKGMIQSRLQSFKQTCNNTSVALTCSFTLLLKDNDFDGYPDINFEQQTLSIFAKPLKIGSEVEQEHTNLTQLSGGERSYVTIAFLLSLWDRISMPFRILDEYDVFMDSNNRYTSVNTLVNTAHVNKRIQYIFLSPQELPNIRNGAHVKVHKMPSPRR